MPEVKKNYFENLFGIDVSGHVEQKNGLNYLSWAWAWAELKKVHPDASYTIYENADGWFYHTDGKTCWVKTGVTVDGLEHIEYLPVMDYRNKSIPADAVTSFDVNKAIQRSLTKAIGRHGLALYIYAGEDLPEGDPVLCERCGKPLTPTKTLTVAQLAEGTKKAYGIVVCNDCGKRLRKEREAEDKVEENSEKENAE